MSAEKTVVVNTGYGSLCVPQWQLDVWNRYGYPQESTLRRMVYNDTVHGDANAVQSDERLAFEIALHHLSHRGTQADMGVASSIVEGLVKAGLIAHAASPLVEEAEK